MGTKSSHLYNTHYNKIMDNHSQGNNNNEEKEQNINSEGKPQNLILYTIRTRSQTFSELAKPKDTSHREAFQSRTG